MKREYFLIILCLIVAGTLPAVVDEYKAFDINGERKVLFDKYNARKMEVFQKHGVPIVNGAPVKTHPAYGDAIKEIIPEHEAMIGQAVGKESGRTGLNRRLFQDAGIGQADFKYSGTVPEKGRGVFGDFEGTLSPKDYDKITKYCVDKKIPCTIEGDYIRINGSDTVLHRGAGAGDKVGNSSFDARVEAQVTGPETAGSGKGQSNYQGREGEFLAKDAKGGALDSVKKMQNAVNSEPATPLDRYLNDQVMAKEANRINAAGGKPIDPRLDAIKKGMDPDLIADLDQPVKKTVLEQTKSAWSEIEIKDGNLRAEIIQKIETAGDAAERTRLKSQLVELEQRQKGAFDVVLKNDGGKAMSEITGREVVAAAESEGRAAGKTVVEAMKKQLPNAGDDLARTVAELEETPAGRALLAKAGELLKVGVKGVERGGLALMVYDGLRQTVETGRKEGVVAGALKGGNVFADFGLMMASPQYGLMRMGTDVGKIAFDATMLAPLNAFTGQMAYDGAEGGFLVQNELKRTELTQRYSSIKEAVEKAGAWFDAKNGGPDVHGLYAGPEAKKRAREALIAQVEADYRQCAAYDIARTSCDAKVAKDGYENIFKNLNMSPAEFAQRFKSEEGALAAIDVYLDRGWAYTDWDKTGVGNGDAKKATRKYLLEVWKDLRREYDVAMLLKADLEKARLAEAVQKDTTEEPPKENGKSWSDYLVEKLAGKAKTRQGDERDLRDAEQLTGLYDTFDSIASLYDSGRKITGSWWDSFFDSSEEKTRSDFEATQNSADAVLNERKSALDASRSRAESEAARRDVEMQSWLSSMSAAYESARAEAQYKRENSWGAWAQSLLMDTARGTFSGLGAGFGNRIGSGIMEHEIAKRYPDSQDSDSTTAVTPTSGNENRTKDTSSGSSSVSSDDNKGKVDKPQTGSTKPKPQTGSTKRKPKPTGVAKTKPKPVPGGSTIRTIDDKPFQPPPDGRNTANEISPGAAKPPQPAHWYCFHCGKDLGVNGDPSHNCLSARR